MRVPRLSVGSWSRVGRGRAMGSDAFASYAPRHASWLARKGAFVAVADSVGPGAEVGERSRRAIEVALRSYYRDASGSPPASLARAFQYANHALLSTTLRPGAPGAGSTLCAAVIYDLTAAVAHVGNARAFLVRPPQVWQLTADHSWLAQHGLNGLSLTQRRFHPRRWDLERALGRDPRVQVDVNGVRLQPGDALVLCSDGVTDALTPAEIGALVARFDSAAAASEIVERAGRFGADDSATCVVVRVMAPANVPTPASFPSLRRAFRLTPPGRLPAIDSRAGGGLAPALYALSVALVLFALAILAAVGA